MILPEDMILVRQEYTLKEQCANTMLAIFSGLTSAVAYLTQSIDAHIPQRFLLWR